MARKNNLRSEASSSIHFDARTKTVMAEATHDNIKEKVQAVREVVPGKSNNEVVLVLQYYDYNVERAIQAYLEDGAKEALQEWNFTGTKQPNKKRKNKKKATGDKAGDKPGSAPPAAAANGKGEPAVNGKTGLPNGDITYSIDQSETDSPLDSPTTQPATTIQDAAKEAAASSTQATRDSSANKVSGTAAEPLPQRQPHKGRGHGDAHHGQGHHQQQQQQHHHHQQQQKQQHGPRERTVSEVSTGSGIGDGHYRKPHQGLEKAIKDLHRQTTSLERLRHLLDHEIDRSYKSMKSVFEELRQGLNDREALLMAEMDVLKQEASEMLQMRQGRAADLKRQVERADRLKDNEVSDLRAEIKHFVSERRHDEDLGRTTRFLFDSDHMLDEMKKFGEVVHVKSMYTARRASVSSVASSSISHDGNHEEDQSQSQEVNELQDRLKNSLKLQNSPTRASSSNNDTSDADFIRSKNSRRRQQNNRQKAQSDSPRQSNSVAASLDVNSNKATIPSSSSPSSTPSGNSSNTRSSNSNNRGQSPYGNSNSGSPGRGGGRGGGSGQGPRGGGRGRGRGGRGGGRGRGGQGYGGDRSRPQSSQGGGSYRPQSATSNHSSSSNTVSATPSS